VILAGASLPDDIDALSGTCRVLNVEAASLDGEGRPVDAAAAEALDDHIRVLLPLNLPHTEDEQEGPRRDTISELLAALPKDLDEPLLRSLVEASSQSEAAVTRALGDRLAEVLTLEAER
jgi:hypothetical protein